MNREERLRAALDGTGMDDQALEDDDPPLPGDWTAEDEHHAALGYLYGWLYTPDELAALAGGAP